MAATDAPPRGWRAWPAYLHELVAPRRQAGMLVRKVSEDLRDVERVAQAGASAEFRVAHTGLQFSVHEHVDSRFLMHIVMAEFTLAVPGAGTAQGDIVVRHRGALRRTGIDFELSCSANGELRSLRDELGCDPELHQALMPLDFTSCVLSAGSQGLAIRIRHFGACEVVGSVPRFRRYIRLAGAQRESLLASLSAFKRLLQAAS